MNDEENVRNFGYMVEATEKMSRPWKENCFKLLKALVITNVLWAGILVFFLSIAYLAPVEVHQGQDFDNGSQSQSYSEGFNGDS